MARVCCGQPNTSLTYTLPIYRGISAPSPGDKQSWVMTTESPATEKLLDNYLTALSLVLKMSRRLKEF